MRKKILSILAAFVMALTGAVATNVVAATPATAEPATAASTPAAKPSAQSNCYTWNSTLRRGSSGAAVTQLQIRIAGWVGTGESLAIDGQFGPATEAALRRFQSGYGLQVDGIAGSETFGQIYALQSADCTPIHFAYSEFNDNCGANNFSGGRVGAATAQENTRRVMWQLEAMRKKLGDRPITISSGFRSVSCNSSVGGSATSRHMYGDSADMGIVTNVHSQCTLYRAARNAGFTEILGPGYPNHNDHVHVANGTGTFHRAPNC
ncbi:peptidase M15 [Saccharomonospora sp. CUA-673]|uniref:M15 family metallopeptidase n=1 Tax=Saccharomonospora sp. CUA-673 TaxID=1904969 RepID=UPI000962FDEF|nr:M15 family metallopeptidase [Saccharomonospora sp. CUA-673]OLT42504.1 peptidase M15 [Saccharomonospora sp. CUA-673]